MFNTWLGRSALPAMQRLVAALALTAIYTGAAQALMEVSPNATTIPVTANRGGPYPASSYVYVVTNNTLSPINWQVTSFRPMVTLAPSTGTLAAGASVSVTATMVTTEIDLLKTQTYPVLLDFRNLTNTGNTVQKFIDITVVPATAPNDNFANATVIAGSQRDVAVVERFLHARDR